MKQLIMIVVCNLIAVSVNAQPFIGAWEHTSTADNGEQLRTVIILTDGYYTTTTYAVSGTFIMSNGGAWTLEDDRLIQQVEFDTKNSERVGTSSKSQLMLSDDNSKMTHNNLKFERIDNGQPGVLQGAWLMSGRTVDDKKQMRDTTGPRKTMKILSGTRFQWIAYNTETKQFMGTGGGTYTTLDGNYVETIEFFSRDDSRVGNSLKFDYQLVDGHWEHKGLSSKGDPINEIWSLRNH